MRDFFLKRFEIGGLNCSLSNVSIGKCKINLLSNVLRSLSRTDERFQVDTREVEIVHPSVSLPLTSRISPENRSIPVSGPNLGREKNDKDAKRLDLPIKDRFSIYSNLQEKLRTIQTIRWADPSDSLNFLSLFSDESADELNASRDELGRNEFRYSILDREGNLVLSDIDSDRPIFSEKGPIVESGFSVRIDLVSINESSQGFPILARAAFLNSKLEVASECELGLLRS